ncbi:hypothetical protein RR46_01322 [Papilio xuthus]|uniref:Uncharacterized protein n=1 Tax=Papilio xuthus TaxID=66420 RepID=A0A0N0PAA0_PAPXU|nr:hypothetical protein RR46_01322 [Papilio xuthus]
MQRLRSLLVGTSAYTMLEEVNLERVPLLADNFDGYHCAQFSTDYLKLASVVDFGMFYIGSDRRRYHRSVKLSDNVCRVR